MPGFHHAMLGPFGCDCQAVQLPRESGGEGADIDHLLDFALTFTDDLAGFDGDQAPKGDFFGA
jgi:hypothetical protein